MRKLHLCLAILMVGLCAVSFADQSSDTSANISKLKSANATDRRQAAEQLGMSRDASAVKPLLDALRDSDPLVRAAVLDSLGMMRASEACDDIGKILTSDTNPNVRQSAAVALN